MSESVPIIDASVVEYERNNGTHVTQQRFYEVGENGKKRQLNNDDARTVLAPQMEELFNTMAANVASASAETNAANVDVDAATASSTSPDFASVFNEIATNHSQEQARQIMDLAVDHAEIFAKMPSSSDEETLQSAYSTITPEENQILTDLVSAYGVDAIDAARKVSRGMGALDNVKADVEKKINDLERKKRARGARGSGDTADLDLRIAVLQGAVDKVTERETQRNKRYRSKEEQRVFKETHDIDPYDFWGFDEKQAAKDRVVTPDVQQGLESQTQVLDGNRSAYAQASAEAQRKGFGRFLLGDQKRVGKLLRKSERLSGWVDSVNTKLDAPVREARERYEQTLDELGGVVAHLSQEAGISTNEIRNLACVALLQEAHQLAMETAEAAIELAGGNTQNAESSRQLQFAGWWARNSINTKDLSKSNKLGLVKKGAVMAGVGLAVGTGVGLIGIGAWAGTMIGGGVAGALARNVNRKQAAGIIELPDAAGNAVELTSAQYKAGQVEHNMQVGLTASFNESTDPFARASDITRAQEHATDQEILGNRRRIRLAFAAGSIGARAGVALGSGIRHTAQNMFGNGGKTASGESSTTTSTSTTTTTSPNGAPINWTPQQVRNFREMTRPRGWYDNYLTTHKGATMQQATAAYRKLPIWK